MHLHLHFGSLFEIDTGIPSVSDLAVHIDGYIAAVAHTVVATSKPTEPATGRKADVICAAYFAGEAALRLLRPGNKNSQITEAIAKVAETFKVSPVESVLSHQLRRFVIDGDKVIINKTTPEQKVEEFTFEEGEAYTIDIVMTTGEGKVNIILRNRIPHPFSSPIILYLI